MPYGVHKMSEVYFDRDLARKVLEVRQYSNNIKELEIIGITNLWNKAMAMDEAELITFTLAALYKYPDLVFAAIAKDRAEILRKGRGKHENNPDI